MQQRDIRMLILIGVITGLAIWVAMPTNPGIHFRVGENRIDRDIRVCSRPTCRLTKTSRASRWRPPGLSSRTG